MHLVSGTIDPQERPDAAYWRTAAMNARTLASTITDAGARLAMLETAIKLEAIARRVHAQETGLKLVDPFEDQKAFEGQKAS